MRGLLVLLVLGMVVSGGAGRAEEATPPAGLFVVYAVTAATERPPVTSIYAVEARSGLRRLLYRDTQEESRALLRIAGSDLVGSGRMVGGRDLYLMKGPATAPMGAEHADALARLRLDGSEGPGWTVPVPLSFSEASVYPLWNRAPLFAVSPEASRVALCALRVGETQLPGPTIRILSAEGREEWRIGLGHRDLEVAELAWSSDGRLLAYVVRPMGDEHTLDESLIPEAGVYLADMGARTTRRLYACLATAAAWGPKADQVTLAVQLGDVWSTREVARVVNVGSGRVVREFSLPGVATALAYSDDGQWLAAQVQGGDGQQVLTYAVAGGWGRPVKLEGEGRIALLGWARLRSEVGEGAEAR